MADSIKANGILQPILVRPRTTGGYEIVAGERRYRAALRAGLARVPIIARDLTDEETLALALVENLLREDISPLETARAVRRLMDDFGWTQDEAARRIGKSRPAVANVLRLLNLPPYLQESLERGEITEGHARALLSREKSDPTRQRRVWQMIRDRGLSVRQVEDLMKQDQQPTPSAPTTAPRRRLVELEALEERLRRALSLKVRLTGTETRGRLEIEWYSDEELDGLIQRLEKEAAVEPEREALLTPKGGSGPIQGLLSSRRPRQ